MPTPWLSWPARLACDQVIGDQVGFGAALPPACTMALVSGAADRRWPAWLLDLPQADHLGRRR